MDLKNSLGLALGAILLSTITTLALPSGEQERNMTSTAVTEGISLVSPSCKDDYVKCVETIDMEQTYVQVCNATLQCTSNYFECDMRTGNTTTTDLPTTTETQNQNS